jgi:hypothetical protein
MTSPTATSDNVTANGRGRRRVRAAVSISLAVLGGILLPLAGLTLWTRNQLLDTDRYVATVAPLASDPAIQDAAVARLTATVLEAVDFESIAAERLPDNAQPLAAPIAAGAEQLVRELADRAVHSDQFQTVWNEANRKGHETMVAALTGEGGTAVETANGQVVLKFGPLAENVLQSLQQRTGLDLGSRVPAERLNASFVLVQSDDLANVQTAVRWLDRLTWLLAIAVIGSLAGAVLAATSRRRGIRRSGWAITMASAVMLAALAVARSRYLSSLPAEVAKPAASATFDILVRNLRFGFRAIGLIGLLILVGSWVRLPSPQAEPSRLASWVAGHVTSLRAGSVMLAAGALLLLNQPSVASVILVIVLAVAVLAAIEYLSRSGRQSPAQVEAPRQSGVDVTR